MSTDKVPSIPGLVAESEGSSGGGGEGSTGSQPPRDPYEFLRDALSAAIALEFATIPPYLCALWSVKDEVHPVAESLREVIQEEMLHLALACNMLVGIGGKPKLATEGFVPTYPDNLPGGVHPGLEVGLGCLSDETLKTFLTIECPAEFPPTVARDQFVVLKPDYSIGRFYDKILTTFGKLPRGLKLSLDRQITGPRSWKVISTVDDVNGAVGIIKSQGEGAPTGPTDSSNQDLAHYFRFKEVIRREMLVKKSNDRFVYEGKLSEPEIWPMAMTPRGGYLEKNVTQEVWDLLHGFDVTYSEVLRALEAAWDGGGQGMLLDSIQKMFELEKFAKPLMRTPIPGGPSIQAKAPTYGPCFRCIPA